MNWKTGYRISVGLMLEIYNNKLPIKSDEESSLVDYMIQISNLDLLKDLTEVANINTLTI